MSPMYSPPQFVTHDASILGILAGLKDAAHAFQLSYVLLKYIQCNDSLTYSSGLESKIYWPISHRVLSSVSQLT